MVLFSLGLDADGVPESRVDVDRGDSSERRPDPVDDAVLDVGVTLAAELEACGQHRVEVTSGGAEG